MVVGQVLINGVIAGSVYALVAVGFSLLFSLVRFLNFAHGALVTIGAFVAYTLVVSLQLPFIVALLVSMLVCGLLGVLIDRVLFRSLRKRHAKMTSFLLVSLALFSFFEALILVFFGSDVRSFTLDKTFSFVGLSITLGQLVAIVSSVVLLLLVQLYLSYARSGIALRAMADDATVAASVGVNTNRAMMLVVFIASVLAGAAGSLIGFMQNVDPLMSLSVVLKGFTAAVLGGIGSIPGAVVGGYVIGLLENIGILFVPSGYKDALTFILLILVLLILPNGLFPKRVRA